MDKDFTIKPITPSDFGDWQKMALELWTDHSEMEMKKILEDLMASGKEAGFICRAGDGSPVGFMNLSVRSDYVEGSKGLPVGYVEGIYVRKPYRKQHLARRFIELAEKWTKDQGFSELASDAELQNENSQAFHKAVGFAEAGRNVHYIKKLS